MARIAALAASAHIDSQDLLRRLIVCTCALALIVAGPSLPW
jgi:hypothetical protein